MLRDRTRALSPPGGPLQPRGCPGQVACPPHVTPDRHRIDEPDGRRVVDLARRRCAPAQGDRRGAAGAAGRRRWAAVLRADVEVGLEGIEILSLTAAKPARSPEKTKDALRSMGTPKRAPDVSVILAPGSGKRAPGRRWRAPETRDVVAAIARRRPASRRGGGDRDAKRRPVTVPRRWSWRSRGAGPGVPASPPRRGRRAPGPRRAPGRADLDRAPQRHAGDTATRADPRGRAAPARRPPGRPPGHRRPRTPPPRPREAAGGSTEALLAMADELLPAVRLADWKDRASVAQTAGQGLPAARAPRRRGRLADGHPRRGGPALAKALQESLDQRTTALREEWLARITNAINDGRVQQARRGLHPAARARHPLPGRAGRPARRAPPERP